MKFFLNTSLADFPIRQAPSTKWNPAGGENGNNFYLGVGPDAKGFDKFISDNLVVYDYAKTDFSDRFIESPVGHSFAAFIPSLDVTFGPQETDDRFKLSSYVKLAESSNGIAPLTEVVTKSCKLGSV